MIKKMSEKTKTLITIVIGTLAVIAVLLNFTGLAPVPDQALYILVGLFMAFRGLVIREENIRLSNTMIVVGIFLFLLMFI